METEMTLSFDMGPEFERWQKLTDEYARELWAMQRGDLRARARVQRLAGEIVKLSSNSSNVLAYPKEQSGSSDSARCQWFGWR